MQGSHSATHAGGFEHPAARRARRRLRRRRVLRWLLMALLVLTIVPTVFLMTNAGRRTVANAIESALDEQIPGTVTIGRLEHFGFARPVIHDLRFRHANGDEVLHVKRAMIDLDIGDLLNGTIGFHGVKVDGGKLVLEVQDDGRTSLEAAFDEKGGGGGGGAKLALRSIHVENFVMLIKPDPSGKHQFELRDITGFVGIWQHGPPGARVRLERIAGKLQRPKFLGEQVTILRADGWVHGAVEHVLSLTVNGRFGKEPLVAVMNYYDRDKTPVELTLDAGGIKGKLAGLGAEVATLFTDTIKIKTP